MKTQTVIEQMSEHVSGMDYQLFPHSLIEKVKYCILDSLECSFTRINDSRRTGAFSSIPKSAAYQNGMVSLFQSDSFSDVANAAFYNALTIAASPRIDIVRRGLTHAGSVVIPVSLALAESRRLSGKQVIEGIVAGYETTIRLGYAFQEASVTAGFRRTAITAPFGAAFAAAKTCGLSSEKCAASVSLASHLCMGLNEWAASGTGEDAFHSAWGARNGISAMLLAEADTPACMTILEGAEGLLSAFHALPYAHLLTEGLGNNYEMLHVEYKPLDACLMLQAPCQTAARLAAQEQIKPEEIDKIDIAVCKQAKDYPGCDNTEHILTATHAQQSIQFGVSSAILKKSCNNIRWIPPYDSAVTELMKRCRLSDEEALSRHYPAHTPARITIHTIDGRHLMAQSDDYVSLTYDEVSDRFMQTAEDVFDQNRVRKLYDLVMHIEELSDIHDLTDLL